MLKTFCLQYQQDGSAVAFAGMLERADKLLLDTIYKYRRIKPHLGSIELNDLYHTAIVGLSKAAKKAKAGENEDEMVARIISYVRCELSTTYPLTKTKRFAAFKRLDFVADECILDNKSVQTIEDIERKAQLILLRHDYAVMLKKGIVTIEDFKIFVLNCAYRVPCRALAERFDKPLHVIQYGIKRTQKKIRSYFKDWEI
jgi:hypothetical protein